ncbi:MAG: hypothetical protein EPO12_08285 [Aquabacterium sp.]|nr:MAG: hypothetical protein EPO12_08285 [Aquabacterium sp.]
MSRRWKQAGTAAALVLAAAAAQAAVAIDDFNVDQQFPGGGLFPELVEAKGDMLWGERLTVGGVGRTYVAGAIAVGGVMYYELEGLQRTALSISWGADLAGDLPVAIDLTQGGINDRLLIRIEVDKATRLTVGLQSYGDLAYSQTFALAASDHYIDFSVPFADLGPDGATLATRATRVTLGFDGASDSDNSARGRIDFIRAVPEPQALELSMLGLLGVAAGIRRQRGR